APGGGPHHHRDCREEAGEVGQGLEVVRRPPAAFERVLRPFAGAFEQHHERDVLLAGELGEPLALRRRAQADRTAHDGEVLGTDEHRPRVDQAVPGDQSVGRDGRNHTAVERPDERAELDERVGIEEPLDPSAGVEATAPALPIEAIAAAHRARRVAALLEVLEQVTPFAHAASQGYGKVADTASAWSSTEPSTVSSTHARFRYRWTSTSQVKPIPPCTWVAALPLVMAASPASILAPATARATSST